MILEVPVSHIKTSPYYILSNEGRIRIRNFWGTGPRIRKLGRNTI
jgi:hypothetical protein